MSRSGDSLKIICFVRSPLRNGLLVLLKSASYFIEKTDSVHNKPGKTFTATSCEASFGVDFLPVRNTSIPALFLRVPL